MLSLRHCFFLTALTAVIACTQIRHTAPLTYAGDARSTIPSLEAEIAKRGYQPACKPEAYCKFDYDENIRIHFKAKGDQVVLVVDVLDGKNRPPSEVEALRAKGDELGREIWAAASREALQREEEAARLAAAEEQADREREAREAKEREASPQPAFPNFELGRKRRDDTSGAQTSSSARCCINGAFYDCPDMAAVNRCAGETASCMMKCMQSPSSGCEDRCLEEHGPDPSACRRDTSRDGECQR